MRPSRLLAAIFALSLLAAPASAGGVLSRLLRIGARGRATSVSTTGGGGHHDVDLAAFGDAVARLREQAPNATRSLRALADVLERAAARPGDAGARRVCVWDPDFRAHLNGVPGGLACLQAAGFGGVEKDARTGTPYLVMRRLPARTLRALCSQVGVQLLVAEERDAEDEVARLVADSPPTDATAAILAAQAALAAERSAEGDGGSDKPGGPSKEEELVQQISGMISGLISELEGQAGAPPRNESVSDGGGGGSGDGAEHGDGDEDGPPQGTPPPVHFRVYRSSGFPGLPPGIGGLPFGLPGGPGGDEEEGEVATLERRLKAAALPAEAEEVASRELKRLRRMSPMHSE